MASISHAQQKHRWIVGITGASGICYAQKLLEVLPKLVDEVHVVFSEAALRVLKDEEGIIIRSGVISAKEVCGQDHKNIFFYNPRDIGAKIASGTMITQGMIVIPCSMGTLGAITHGISNHLVHRAADVTLKEGRKLIVVPREAPLSTIHLKNMLTLSELGVRIVPAMPGFYSSPKSIDDLISHFIMKILDSMEIHTDLAKRWLE
jgi:4-hydroxy-3-polyprenylbenzoate decarboxylase